jgi:4-hydroxy-tetrahydrodipicolinate synthase
MNVDWQGIFAVAVTPFDGEGRVDEAVFRKLVGVIVDDGADGIIVVGGAGEFYALDFAERKRLFAAAVEEVNGRIPVLAGIAALQVEQVRDDGIAAFEVGCDGAMVLAPLYAKPGDREIVAFYDYLCREMPLPMMAYNCPPRNGINFSTEVVKKLSGMDQVVALKDSSGDIRQASRFIHAAGEGLRYFAGTDDWLLPVLAIGGHGGISMGHQVAGRLIRDMVDAYQAGDLAEASRLHHDICAVYACINAGSMYACLKETMAQLGRSVGGPRLPLLAADDGQQAKIAKIIELEGLDKYRDPDF